MNALTRSVRTAIPRAKTATRSMSSGGSGFSLASLKNNVWLSDPGAYPVIGVLVFASAMCTYFGTHTLLTNADVRINTTKRQGIIRTWNGNDKYFFQNK